jgi:arylsulfatase A
MTPGSGGWGHSLGMKHPPTVKGLPGQLYDMDADHFEANNLVLTQPERVQQLKALLHQIVADGRSTPGPKQSNDAAVIIK